MISRRGFLALASGLLVPEPEPVRVYSFLGAAIRAEANGEVISIRRQPTSAFTLTIEPGQFVLLMKGQQNQARNGIYVVGEGVCSRATESPC